VVKDTNFTNNFAAYGAGLVLTKPGPLPAAASSTRLLSSDIVNENNEDY
jgi:hypothetical protein